MQILPDLNVIQTVDDEGGPPPKRHNGTAVGPVEVYFTNHAQRLIRHILNADLVLGCVAWLTHSGILAALAQRQAAIVVQKEDFLRPDVHSRGNWNQNNWKEWLRKCYGALHCGPCRYEFPGLIQTLSYNSDPTVDGVRCVGNYNRDKLPAFPRMHHKFVVFCHLDKKNNSHYGVTYSILPYGVWTGSFNFTRNAQLSLENALYLCQPQVVNAYYNEFAHVYSLSEPLDWTSEWCEPEYRIGT